MTNLHPLRQFEELEVRVITRLCHPGLPPRPLRWHEAHPTLVLQVQGAIVGYTAYSVVMQPEVCSDGEVMIGYGIDIHPDHQGKGYGRLLCTERLAIARAVGTKVFVGHAEPGNLAMHRIFEQDGFKPMAAQTMPDGSTLVIFMGPVK